MITTSQLVDLISKADESTGRGRFKYLAGDKSKTENQRRFFQDFETMYGEPRLTYSHPNSGPMTARPEGPLTPAEIAWVQRQFPPGLLPSEVSHADARTLAALDAAISPIKYPGESRMVRAVYDPIREYHDRRAAETQLANAGRNARPIPDRALAAMADAVNRADPSLPADVVVSRAGELVKQAAAARDRTRETAEAHARKTLTRLEEAAAARTAPTPDAMPARAS